jgi:hypothetical protein
MACDPDIGVNSANLSHNASQESFERFSLRQLGEKIR